MWSKKKMAEARVSNHSKQTTDDVSVGVEAETETSTETKEIVSELTALGNEFRRLLDPEVITTSGCSIRTPYIYPVIKRSFPYFTISRSMFPARCSLGFGRAL